MRPYMLLAALCAVMPILAPSPAAPPPQCATPPTREAKRPAPKSWAVEVAARAQPRVVSVECVHSGTGRKVYGAGWAVRPDLVVTCAHVIGKARTVKLTRPCGKETTADVALTVPAKDVAFLRPRKGDRLPPLKLRDRPAEQGEDVIVMGHPYRLGWSLSRGVVSAVGRALDMGEDYDLADMVQTDAAISPGNSGGPLLDRDGGVIGMVSVRRTDVGGIAWCVSARTIARLLRGPG